MYTYPAKLVRVVDGDTVVMTVDLGFSVSVEVEFRLFGINAPETKGATKAAGLAAKDHLIDLMSRGRCVITSVKPPRQDKYGRWLAHVAIELPDGTSFLVSDRMVSDGHAVTYVVS
jgi:micrococcal nuclease